MIFVRGYSSQLADGSPAIGGCICHALFDMTVDPLLGHLPHSLNRVDEARNKPEDSLDRRRTHPPIEEVSVLQTIGRNIQTISQDEPGTRSSVPTHLRPGL